MVEAQGLYPSPSIDLEVDEEGWSVGYKVPVVFSDDAAKFQEIEIANQRRGELCQRREDLREEVDAAQQV